MSVAGWASHLIPTLASLVWKSPARTSLPMTETFSKALTIRSEFASPMTFSSHVSSPAKGNLAEASANGLQHLADQPFHISPSLSSVMCGGQCALQLVLRHSERCCGLVTISACSAPLTSPRTFWFLFRRVPGGIEMMGSPSRRRG